MSKTTTNLIGIVITILAGIYFYMMYCSECGTIVQDNPVKETLVEEAVPKATSYPFAIADGDYEYQENDNYNFPISASRFNTPLSPNITNAIASVKDFLAENSEKIVDITGFYKSEEKNESAFPNLGLARANAVKNHFVENGIPSAQINTFGLLKDEMVPENDIFLGPVSYKFEIKADNAEDELKTLHDKIKDNPLVLNFNTAQTHVNLSAEQRQKFADISKYLDKAEGAMAIIEGHTDNTGSNEKNIEIGMDRANFAKNYLIKNGISASKIKATSKGSSSPIASNDTEEGRAQNRRTIITLN